MQINNFIIEERGNFFFGRLGRLRRAALRYGFLFAEGREQKNQALYILGAGLLSIPRFYEINTIKYTGDVYGV